MGYRDSRPPTLVSQRYWEAKPRQRGGRILSALLDQDWRAQALCAKFDPNLFFAPGAVEHKEAKRVCRECPVRMECLTYAMNTPVDHGIWGGMTERERRRHRRQRTQLLLGA
ncbi:MAG: WhiB family transcriptional regulator [Actinobacteria bacterium]|nr:WhiB family transcriptional regulator [Actinomycetota bacterium]